jgi:hypothetical protein
MIRLRFATVVMISCAWAMAAKPPSSISPEPPPSEQTVHKLIADLNHADFSARERAADALREMPASALPMLETQLKTNLSPEAEDRLQSAIMPVRARARLQADIDRMWNWAKIDIIDDFEERADRNAPWYPAARETVEWLATEYGARYAIDTRKMDVAKWRSACERAVKLGCKDPLVNYADALLDDGPRGVAGSTYRAAKFQTASDLLEAAQCSPILRATALKIVAANRLQILHAKSPVVLEKEQAPLMVILRKAVDRAIEAARQPHHHPSVLASCLGEIEGPWMKVTLERQSFIDAIEKPLQQAMPNASFPKSFLAITYTAYGWDAYIEQNRLPNGAAVMRERYAKAKQLAIEAFEIDPTDSFASMAAIEALRNGGGTLEEVMMWVDRTIEHDPNNFDVFSNAMNSFDPRRGGSREMMLAFADKMVRTENYDARLPLLILSAHIRLASDRGRNTAPNPQYFIDHPEAWQQIEPVAKRHLARSPYAVPDRAVFTSIALYSEQWAEASEQIRILGVEGTKKLERTMMGQWPAYRQRMEAALGSR